jgi:hypothetical protein
MPKKRSGYNTNLASEFYVLSVLYRLGMDANLTLGNKKSVDIVVVRSAGQAATIDVKAVADKLDWLLGNVPEEPRAHHFIALVSFEGKIEDPTIVPAVWIVPHAALLPLVKTSQTGDLRYLSRTMVVETLTAYRDAWHLLAAEVAA